MTGPLLPGENRAMPEDDRIRVLQLIHSLHFGGAEKVVAQLATGLDQSRFDVRIACLREAGRIGDQVRQSGLHVTSGLQSEGWSRYFAAYSVLREIRAYRPHFVHTHGVAAMVAAGPLAYLRLLPEWFHTFHFGNYPYRNKRHMLLERLFSRRATKLIAVANSQRNAVLLHHRIAEDRIALIANGVPPNEYLTDFVRRRAKRAEFGLTDDHFVFGTICVMSEQKGVEYLLDAAAIVLRAHPSARFLLVGGGPLEDVLRARSRQLGLDNNVLFTGWRADVAELMMSLDVFVMASLWEAMPLALLEAMAARRAIVVTDVGDNADFVAGGDCGLLVRPRDAANLAVALSSCASDRELVRHLGENAFTRYQTHYAVSHMIDAHERLYRAGQVRIKSNRLSRTARDPGRAGVEEQRLQLRDRLKIQIKSLANIHRPGGLPDIFLFATARGGSTWLMEIIGSQPGMKLFDEPLNPRRKNVAHSGLFPDYRALMPEARNQENIIGYLRELQSGRRGHINQTPFQRHHRFLTNRSVFKIHEVEHLICDIERACGGMIVILLRHPIATSLSRKVLPRIDLFLKSRFYADLLGDASRLAEINRLVRIGNYLQRAVIDWCYSNLVPLRCPGRNWLFVTYEELVLNPESSCELLMSRLQLPDRESMLVAFERPAANISMSRSRTLAAMRQSDASIRRRQLVSKWQNEATAADVEAANVVLSLFGIDAYDASGALPHSRFLHFEDTARLLAGP